MGPSWYLTAAVVVASYLLSIAGLLLGPLLVGKVLRRRWALPTGAFALGALTFIGAEVLRLASSRAAAVVFAETMWAPDEVIATILGAALAGLASAVIEEGLRWWSYRKYLEPAANSPAADSTDQLPAPSHARQGALAGLGLGAGHAALLGALMLIMSAIALSSQDMTFQDMQGLGLDAKLALKLGLRINAWWESSPWAVLVSALEMVPVLIFHVGLGSLIAVAVCKSERGWLAVAIGAHFVLAAGLAYGAEATEVARAVELAALVFATLAGAVALRYGLRSDAAA